MKEDGVWRTINGARVFIRNGETPMDAFIRQKSKKKKTIYEDNENEESTIGTYEVYKNGYKCNIEVKQFNNGKNKMYAVDNPFKGFEWSTNFYKTEDAVKKFLSKHNATKRR